jgi:hypothetical protein
LPPRVRTDSCCAFSRSRSAPAAAASASRCRLRQHRRRALQLAQLLARRRRRRLGFAHAPLAQRRVLGQTLALLRQIGVLVDELVERDAHARHGRQHPGDSVTQRLGTLRGGARLVLRLLDAQLVRLELRLHLVELALVRLGLLLQLERLLAQRLEFHPRQLLLQPTHLLRQSLALLEAEHVALGARLQRLERGDPLAQRIGGARRDPQALLHFVELLVHLEHFGVGSLQRALGRFQQRSAVETRERRHLVLRQKLAQIVHLNVERRNRLFHPLGRNRLAIELSASSDNKSKKKKSRHVTEPSTLMHYLS